MTADTEHSPRKTSPLATPVSNPFFDPVSLQAFDRIVSGTITIAPLEAIPSQEPGPTLLMGLTLLGIALRSGSVPELC